MDSSSVRYWIRVERVLDDAVMLRICSLHYDRERLIIFTAIVFRTNACKICIFRNILRNVATLGGWLSYFEFCVTCSNFRGLYLPIGCGRFVLVCDSIIQKLIVEMMTTIDVVEEERAVQNLDVVIFNLLNTFENRLGWHINNCFHRRGRQQRQTKQYIEQRWEVGKPEALFCEHHFSVNII
jgi:hypothetical protein